jgi:hypothetical protein
MMIIIVTAEETSNLTKKGYLGRRRFGSDPSPLLFLLHHDVSLLKY